MLSSLPFYLRWSSDQHEKPSWLAGFRLLKSTHLVHVPATLSGVSDDFPTYFDNLTQHDEQRAFIRVARRQALCSSGTEAP